MRMRIMRLVGAPVLVLIVAIAVASSSLLPAAATSAGGIEKKAPNANRVLSARLLSTRVSSLTARLANRSDALTALAVVTDDNIPGVVLPASPVRGTLDDVTDVDDVYAVNLTAGQQFTFVMTGAAGSNFNIDLFAQTATDVLVDDPVDGSEELTYPEAFTYTASTTGTYYLDVWAEDGSGAYTLAYYEDVAANDEIPGVALPASPFTSSLDAWEDTDDVYAITLGAGDVLSVGLTNFGGNDFDVYLYDTTASTVTTDTGIIEGSNSTSSAEAFTFTATHAGTYFLDVWAYEGVGTYTLSYWNTVSAPSAAASVYRAMPLTVTGYIKPRYTAGTYPVRIYKYLMVGTEWVSKGFVNAKTSDYLTFSKYAANVPLPTAGRWMLRAYHPADATHGAIWSGGSAYVTVKDISVGTPVAPSTMYRTRYSKVYGTLTPRETAGTYPVRIYKYRYVRGRWVSYGYVKARASNYSSYSRYAASVKLPYAGKWKVRAFHPAHGTHPAKWSTKYDSVTVR